MTRNFDFAASDLMSPGINVLFDGQWGSTGKGKLSAFLAYYSDCVWNTADFQPNAGHTVVIDGGEYVTKSIPSGYVNLDAKLFLTAGATINPDVFMREVEMLDPVFGIRNRLWIHPHAGVVFPEDIAEEQEMMGSIASTMTGGGAALRRKVARKALLAKDVPALQPYVKDCTFEILQAARAGARVLSETAQGFDLSLNHGWQYPYTTSRDVTPASTLNNLGAPPQLLARSWASMRTMPIRVGHFYDPETGEKIGDSGPFYPDQQELSWDEVHGIAGTDKDLTELTTVTKRVRRIFTWSRQQYSRMLQICQPTDIFMNFANYLDDSITGATGQISDFPGASFPKVDAFCDEINQQAVNVLGNAAPSISLIGTGADNEEMLWV